MVEEESVAAAIGIIRNLAKGAIPTYNPPDYRLSSINGTLSSKIKLPGSENVTKRSLEQELSDLCTRVQYLEAKASTVNNPALPDTPSEFGIPTSPFGSSYYAANPNCNTTPSRQGSMGSARHARVSNLLAVQENGDTDNRIFTQEELGQLRDHVQRQAQEIKTQRETIASVQDELKKREDAEQTFFKTEHKGIDALQWELSKHQKSNAAFQKALKEIGTIITNVAKGDLSHKVLIHSVEQDPEIRTFKQTINTMMDQLQLFGSEVSRVAREVGTEGKLGGQAQITGVSGIWAELTKNGDILVPSLKIANRMLIFFSQ